MLLYSRVRARCAACRSLLIKCHSPGRNRTCFARSLLGRRASGGLRYYAGAAYDRRPRSVRMFDRRAPPRAPSRPLAHLTDASAAAGGLQIVLPRGIFPPLPERASSVGPLPSGAVAGRMVTERSARAAGSKLERHRRVGKLRSAARSPPISWKHAR